MRESLACNVSGNDGEEDEDHAQNDGYDEKRTLDAAAGREHAARIAAHDTAQTTATALQDDAKDEAD